MSPLFRTRSFTTEPKIASRQRAPGQLAKRDQVALAEELADRPLRVVGDVDLPLPQTLDQVVGRQIDQLDLVGLFQDRVRDRLVDLDAGDLRYHVVQALQVLDV